MITWSDRRYYSLDYDCMVARVSGFDDNHQEHWTEIEAGRGYASRRTEALERIMESIERGDEPGEIN